MFGGADTTGNTLMVGTHRLLKNPEKMQRLKAELMKAWPSLTGREPSLRDLEGLPYLNAVIKESLRLSSGVVSGLLRVVPPTGATITGVTVPPGVRFTWFDAECNLADKYPDNRFMWQYFRSLQQRYLRKSTRLHARALARVK